MELILSKLTLAPQIEIIGTKVEFGGMRMNPISEITKLRRDVLERVAQWALSYGEQYCSDQEVQKMAKEMIPDGPARYRCCIYKERAIMEERIQIALGKKADDQAVTVIKEACNGCSLNKYVVTDACQNCVAHHCRNSCPKKAISVVENRAFIDHNTCVECGICAKSCPYHAIVEISRPCERSCATGAVGFDEYRRAVIDYEKCVSCGICVTVCPFGAITDSSQIVDVVCALKNKEKPMVAVIAPAIAGQFGVKVTPRHVKTALMQLGFADVYEAAFGADIVAEKEADELKERYQQKLMTNSCCPAHAKAIAVKMPEHTDKVSATMSPMRVTGQLIKEKYQGEVTVVFIGPCIAKKAEAKLGEEIDMVITFEEITAIFAAAKVNPADCSPTDMTGPSAYGRLFARSGGVGDAVVRHLSDLPVEVIAAQGLRDCLKAFKTAVNKKDGEKFLFVEGMACEGGCIGGPGTLAKPTLSCRALEKFAKEKE